MVSIDKTTYLSPDDYARAIEVLRNFSVNALLWLAEKSSDNLKNQIIMNFIARGTVCLDSIHILWTAGNYQDCWVLHRALVDRLIHLKTLIDHDEFEKFERWSFQKQYQSADATFSDPSIIEKLTPEALAEAKRLHNERRSRFRQEPKSDWRRPDAKESAKRMNLPDLYSLGYDPASGEVHPMADDGKEEFHDLLGIPLQTSGDNRTVLHNSLVIQFLLVQYGINGCDVLWRSFVYDSLENWFCFLETGSYDQLAQCVTAFELDSNISWCEPNSE